MIGFYVIIALWTWFYTGQPDQRAMLGCGTVAEALAHKVTAEGVTEHLSRGLL
jgi:hypothetical protein